MVRITGAPGDNSWAGVGFSLSFDASSKQVLFNVSNEKERFLKSWAWMLLIRDLKMTLTDLRLEFF